MKFDPSKLDPEKLLRFAHLRPRIVSEEEKRYGTFHRRMVAATLDSLWMTMIIAPLVDMVFTYYYGQPPSSINAIAHQAEQIPDAGESRRIFWEQMETSGYLGYWGANLRWYIFSLCICITICWHYWAATPGKMICGLKIVDAKTGGKMGDWQSIIRLLGYFVSAIPLGLGFFWIGFDRKRRGWHDLIAGTVVVRKKFISAPEADHPSDSPAP